MKRRDFIHTTVSGTFMLTVTGGELIKSHYLADNRNITSFDKIDQQWIVSDDGRFSIETASVKILNCYPAIDGRQITPEEVNIDKTGNEIKIEYVLKNERLILTFRSVENSLMLESRFYGDAAPHWIYPLAGGEIQGADSFFKQGLGFAGPSGIFPFRNPEIRLERDYLKEDVWSHDSYLATGLVSEDTSIVLGAYDHSNFLNRSTLYNRQYRYGLIDRHLDTNSIYLETGFSMENISLKNGYMDLPAIHLFAGTDIFQTLQGFALTVAEYNKVKLTKPQSYHWCSWYEFESDFSKEILDDFLKNLALMKPAIPIMAIQIDDGYCERGDWLIPNEKWPGGIEAAFQTIKKHGYEPGIWVAPFMVSSNSILAKEHPDWLLKDIDGKTVIEWNSQDTDMMVLDSSHPDAFNYLRKVFRTMKKWGALYYKTDFLDWGLRDSLKYKRHTPGKTSVQYFRDVAVMIREEIDDESFWLACIAPFQPMIGLVDAMRLSNDVVSLWTRESTFNMFREMKVGQYFNNIFWQNDPDVIYLRDHNMDLSHEEKYTIALWDGILGGVINTSDRFHLLSNDFIRLWRFLQPSTEKINAELPFWEDHDGIFVAVKKYSGKESIAVLFVNPQQLKLEKNYSFQDLSHIQNPVCYIWKPGNFEKIEVKNELNIQLDPHSSILFYITNDEEIPPSNLGLNGHTIDGI